MLRWAFRDMQGNCFILKTHKYTFCSRSDQPEVTQSTARTKILYEYTNSWKKTGHGQNLLFSEWLKQPILENKAVKLFSFRPEICVNIYFHKIKRPVNGKCSLFLPREITQLSLNC